MQPPETEIEPSHLDYLGFRLLQPSAALRPYVRSYWYFRSPAPLVVPREEYMHPRGGYGIAFNFGDTLRLDTQPIREPVFLDGTNTVSRKMGFQGAVEVLGVNFHVGEAFPFLAVPLVELRDEITLLDTLDTPSLMVLYGRLYEAKALAERVALIEQWLLDRLALGKARSPIIPATLAALRHNDGQIAIPSLADTFAISQRQLERLYQMQVGMTPKHYARLLRVEAARLALKNLNQKSTTDLAVDLGFYDQSHFIREFSAVIGMTPYRYLARKRG